MSGLLLHAGPADEEGTILDVTPRAAGWQYVGFEVLSLERDAVAHRDTGEREVCVVVVEGLIEVASEHGEWGELGGRPDPWTGRPDAAYLPPRTSFSILGQASRTEVALCWAPAPRGGAPARVLPGAEIEVETRGYGPQERTIHPILMADLEAESLLVCRGAHAGRSLVKLSRPTSTTVTTRRPRPSWRRPTTTASARARGSGCSGSTVRTGHLTRH